MKPHSLLGENKWEITKLYLLIIFCLFGKRCIWPTSLQYGWRSSINRHPTLVFEQFTISNLCASTEFANKTIFEFECESFSRAMHLVGEWSLEFKYWSCESINLYMYCFKRIWNSQIHSSWMAVAAAICEFQAPLTDLRTGCRSDATVLGVSTKMYIGLVTIIGLQINFISSFDCMKYSNPMDGSKILKRRVGVIIRTTYIC